VFRKKASAFLNVRSRTFCRSLILPLDELMTSLKKPMLPIGIVAAALLFVAVFHMPLLYYTFLRFVVCGAALIIGAFSYKRELYCEAIACGLIALLFNPIVSVHLERDSWQIVDVLTALGFIYLGFLSPPPLGSICCYERGDFDKAEEACANAVTHGDLGQYEAAIELLKEIIRINPESAEAHYNLGVAYYRSANHWEGLEEPLRQMISGDYPAFAHDRYDDAVKACEQAIRIKSDYAAAYNILGAVYSALGRNVLAIDACGQAIRIKPDFGEAHFNLGLAHRERGDIASALKEIKILKLIDSDKADLLFTLAYMWYRKGSFAVRKVQ
jgi:tetratricopeptide (TPR) repeat protein